MIIGAASVRLYAPWVRSLKEKRMVVQSIMAKVKNRLNVSIAETDAQDLHKTIVLGLACVAGTVKLADSVIDAAVAFIGDHTEAEIVEVRREIR